MYSPYEIACLITELSKNKKISINQMLKECSLPSSVVDVLKRGSMASVDKLAKIAIYFNVSMDYLLGLINNPVSLDDSHERLTNFELYYIKKYRLLNENGKHKATMHLEDLLANPDNFAAHYRIAARGGQDIIEVVDEKDKEAIDRLFKAIEAPSDKK